MGVKSLAPYVRSTHSLRHMMADVIIALCVLLVIPVVETGPRLAVTAVGTVGVCYSGGQSTIWRDGTGTI